jgi:hypothetical protein
MNTQPHAQTRDGRPAVIRERRSIGAMVIGGILIVPALLFVLLGLALLFGPYPVIAIPVFVLSALCGIPGVILWADGASRPPEWLELHSAKPLIRRSTTLKLFAVLSLLWLTLLVGSFLVVASITTGRPNNGPYDGANCTLTAGTPAHPNTNQCAPP